MILYIIVVKFWSNVIHMVNSLIVYYLRKLKYQRSYINRSNDCKSIKFTGTDNNHTKYGRNKNL